MPPTSKPVPAAPSAKNPLPLLIGIVVGVVALVALAFVLIGRGSNGGDGVDTKSLPTPTFADGDVLEFRGVEVTGDALERLPDSGNDPAAGLQAPALVGQAFNGTRVEITPGDGQPLMLVFLAHWCPHCNAEVPTLLEWYQNDGLPSDLRVIGVATGTDQNNPNYPPSKWLKDFKWPWDVIADSPQAAASTAYGLNGYPFIVIVDGDGKVVLRTSGEHSLQQIDSMVDAALGIGTDTSLPVTTDGPSTKVTDAPTTEAPTTEAPAETTAP